MDGTETEIVQNSKYLLSGGYHRILTIKSPETSDTGLYRCKASYSGQTYPPVILDANLTVYGRFVEAMILNKDKWGDNICFPDCDT